MKTILITLLMATALCGFAQSKKNIEQELAVSKSLNDSLQATLTKLTKEYDSIKGRQVEFDTMYQIIKEKYIGFNFKPADIGHIVDSLRAKRDSTLAKSSATAMVDTVAVQKIEPLVEVSESPGNEYLMDSLQQELNHFRFVFDQYFAKGTIPQTTG